MGARKRMLNPPGKKKEKSQPKLSVPSHTPRAGITCEDRIAVQAQILRCNQTSTQPLSTFTSVPLANLISLSESGNALCCGL